MNSYERVMARLRGEPVDRPPNFNIMMQFAADMIKQPFSAYYQDYRVLCAANFAVQEAFKPGHPPGDLRPVPRSSRFRRPNRVSR